MDIRGRVQNGVVVPDEPLPLPEGLPVTILVPPRDEASQVRRRVSLPLVPSRHPGTLDLTAERVAEILSDLPEAPAGGTNVPR